MFKRFYKILGLGCFLIAITLMSCGESNNEIAAPVEEGDTVVRILAIGNSFSMDATERHLRELAGAKGIELLIANLYISGAPLQVHWDNAKNNNAAYEYRRIDGDGVLQSLKGVSISQALVDESWDYIAFQQGPTPAGQYETYVEPLPLLFDYVTEFGPEDTQFIFHQTWAYAQDATIPGFTVYNNNQEEMYNAIVSATAQAYDLVDFDIFIPAGTAIQNGRTSWIGDKFTRDGYHLNELGRYTAACTWFEAIFQQSVIGNPYQPEGISEEEASIAKHAAHLAIETPHEVTVLADYGNE